MLDGDSGGRLRFDIGLLARRLEGASSWLASGPATSELRLGYFGASTGAAAALVAASRWTGEVGAIVSRGGRPDLAGAALAVVHTPTLLIVGGDDHVVIELNRRAVGHDALREKLEIVPGATHLFEESGALERVAELAAGVVRTSPGSDPDAGRQVNRSGGAGPGRRRHARPPRQRGAAERPAFVSLG